MTMVWGFYRLCPLFGFAVSSGALFLGCGARTGLHSSDYASAEAGSSGEGGSPGDAPMSCTGLLPDSVPNADCGTRFYRLCPIGQPNPNPIDCSPGMRVTDPEVWCCGGYQPPAGCSLGSEAVRSELCASGQSALISCPGQQLEQPFAGCTGPLGQDAPQVTGTDWCCP